MTEQQLHEAVVQARRLLLNPSAAATLPINVAVDLVIRLSTALCTVAPPELLVPPAPTKQSTVDARLDASPKPVTVSSH